MNCEVSVVIPTWNGKAMLTECLRSLQGQTVSPGEIIVVDDGSTDDTVEIIRRDFPEIRLQCLTANRGFCGAVNEGIKCAKEDWILLLNNDMTFESDFLENLFGATEAHDSDMLTPLILWRDEPEIIYAAGDRQLRNGRPESVGFRAQREGFEFPASVFGVTAGAGLYRRSVFDTVGLFDERFACYFEDSDLNFRARLAGFSARCVPESVVYHIGSASLGDSTLSRTRQCCRNHAMLVIKNMPAPLLVKYGPRIIGERLRQLWRVFSASRCEFGTLRALWFVANTWAMTVAVLPHALRERRHIQLTRKITSRELDTSLD